MPKATFSSLLTVFFSVQQCKCVLPRLDHTQDQSPSELKNKNKFCIDYLLTLTTFTCNDDSGRWQSRQIVFSRKFNTWCWKRNGNRTSTEQVCTRLHVEGGIVLFVILFDIVRVCSSMIYLFFSVYVTIKKLYSISRTETICCT